ncbi:MAG: 50S ribosomal protein L23 [bacterium]|jgi:large subunit ribosomal protein L23
MKTIVDGLIQPIVTEKSARLEKKHNDVAVLVDQKMNKVQIAKAVQSVFGIKPLSVRIVNFRKKEKKNKFSVIAPQSFKKAYLRLPEGKRLELK